jgi:hypothetical protein
MINSVMAESRISGGGGGENSGGNGNIMMEVKI